jgi:MFS family permease
VNRLAVPLVLGSMLNPVNSSMLAVALIPIGAAFGASPATTVWLVSSLYVTTAVGQPVVGRLVDRFGARPLYLAGAALVGAAGLLGVFAPSLGVLIIARVLIGLGTSAAYPAAMRLLRDRADGDNRGMLTALAVAGQVIAVVGPTLGGVLIGVGGWRLIFGVNVPFSVACLVLGARRLPRGGARPGVSIDWPGIGLFAVTLVSLLLFVMDPPLWPLLVLAVVAGAGFAVRELRTGEPFLDLRLLGGNRPLLATYLRQALTYTVAYSFTYGFVQWLEEGRGLSAAVTGLVVLPMSAVAILVATVAGRSREVRGKLLVGSAVLVVTCVALWCVDEDTGLWVLVAFAALVGVPQGLNGLANQNALYRQADPARMGTAAGLLRTFMYLGAMASSAAVAAAFPHGALTDGLHRLAVPMLVCAVLLLAVTVVDRSLRKEVT